MERKFDCPESGEKCNRPDCSIKYCADRKDLEARESDRPRVPREKEPGLDLATLRRLTSTIGRHRDYRGTEPLTPDERAAVVRLFGLATPDWGGPGTTAS